MTSHASVKRPTIVKLRLSALIRQSSEAIAFLESVLESPKPGMIKLHIDGGKIIAWAFTPAGRMKKDVDSRAGPPVG